MSEDNIDRSFMQRQTIREVEQLFADMSENARRKGYADPVIVSPSSVTFSYEEFTSPDSIFRELYAPHRPNPRLVLTNDTPIETDKPKANLYIITE